MEMIHAVELVGSGSRTPAITRLLASLFNKEPGRTVNASECVARGCALQCAMLNPIFRCREYEVQDSFPFSIGLSSDKGPICTLSNSMLFPTGQLFPSVKIITLHRKDMFTMEAFYGRHNEFPPAMPNKISSFTVGPFHISHLETAKIKVRILLNLHGIVTVESASLIEDVIDANITSVQTEANPDCEPSLANGAETEDINHTQSKRSSMAGADGVRKAKAVKRLDIAVNESVYGGLTKDELLEAGEKELKLADQDLKMERTKDKKNALESYVYDMRNKILYTYISVATEPEREEISRNLQETEDWLYEDGADESEIVYSEKLALKKLVDPVESRYNNEESRSRATRL